MQHIVAPFAGAWIEIVQRKKPDGESWSLPLRERGLKLIIHLKKKGTYKSLPLRERGLKLSISNSYCVCCNVAPFAGAWIEIQTMLLE